MTTEREWVTNAAVWNITINGRRAGTTQHASNTSARKKKNRDRRRKKKLYIHTQEQK